MITPIAVGGGVACALMGIGYATAHPASQIFGTVIHRGTEADPRQIALTFDDGPSPVMTEQVLSILKQHGVAATFFCIGHNVEQHPDVLQKIHNAGHLIANHSYDHPRDSCFHGRRYWTDQIVRTRDAIEKVIGYRTRFFRPPMGLKTPRILWAARRLEMTTVTWSQRGLDSWSKSPEKICHRLTRNLTAGNILVMHDGVEPGRRRSIDATAAALPLLIEKVRAAGLQFATLDQVVHLPTGQNIRDASPS